MRPTHTDLRGFGVMLMWRMRAGVVIAAAAAAAVAVATASAETALGLTKNRIPSGGRAKEVRMLSWSAVKDTNKIV